jgi:hypothetical protein
MVLDQIFQSLLNSNTFLYSNAFLEESGLKGKDPFFLKVFYDNIVPLPCFDFSPKINNLKERFISIRGVLLLLHSRLYIYLVSKIDIALFDVFMLHLYPNFTILYYGVVRYDFYRNNPLFIITYVIIMIMKTRFKQIFTEILYYLYKIKYEELIGLYVDKLTKFKEEIFELKKMNKFLKLRLDSNSNISKLKQLNLVQLNQNKRELVNNLETVEEIINEKQDSMTNQETTMKSSKCVICLDKEPEIKFISCCHQCICEDCLNDFFEKENTLTFCFLCNKPIDSWKKEFVQFSKKVSLEEYNKESHFFTFQELSKLNRNIN